MILRPYDDYTRKRALMYQVVAIVDNWGTKDAQRLKELRKKVNAAIEADDTSTVKRLNKVIDKLQEKLQKKSKYRFDYVLNKPVSLHNAEAMQKVRAKGRVDGRARKVC